MSQQHLNQPIETDKQNHIGECHAAAISDSRRQSKEKYEYDKMEGLPNGGLLLGTRFQLEELEADSRRIRKQTRNRTTATAVMSSIRSIFGTILNRSAHDAYRARYMLQQQWRSITDVTLQHCAERRIALIKENSQVKKNIFQRNLHKLGVDTLQKNLQTILQSGKIIFSRKGKNWESIHRKEFADTSRTSKTWNIQK